MPHRHTRHDVLLTENDDVRIDQIYTSHNASCSTSHNAQFRTEMCISVQNGQLWNMAEVHCGNSEFGLLEYPSTVKIMLTVPIISYEIQMFLTNERTTYIFASYKSHPTKHRNSVRQSQEGVSKIPADLTHWGLVTPYGDSDLGQHWLR